MPRALTDPGEGSQIRAVRPGSCRGGERHGGRDGEKTRAGLERLFAKDIQSTIGEHSKLRRRTFKQSMILADSILQREGLQTPGLTGKLAELGNAKLNTVGAAVNGWTVKPVGSEGYRTAEVTLGGVDTAALDQQTMAATTVPGLYFIGEVVDITGWLGGYNFQWAWSSGWVAGQAC